MRYPPVGPAVTGQESRGGMFGPMETTTTELEWPTMAAVLVFEDGTAVHLPHCRAVAEVTERHRHGDWRGPFEAYASRVSAQDDIVVHLTSSAGWADPPVEMSVNPRVRRYLYRRIIGWLGRR